MGHISGRLWIDEGEYELAKVEVCLGEPVHFGPVGVVGALNELTFSIFRNRCLDGAWENSLVKVWLQFRLLLDVERFQYEERISPLPPGDGTTKVAGDGDRRL